jgi:hypothetical protein
MYREMLLFPSSSNSFAGQVRTSVAVNYNCRQISFVDALQWLIDVMHFAVPISNRMRSANRQPSGGVYLLLTSTIRGNRMLI